MLTRYISWEMLAIHLVTGALFALVNVILVVALLPDLWWIVVALAPLQLFGAWGWWAEARFVGRVSREIRARASTTR